MPLTPYAAVQMSIAGGGNVAGGQVIVGGQTVQLSGVNTSGWVTQLWEIPAFPVGFATPAGWTLSNGVLQSSAVAPPVFTPPVAQTLWGKYLFRLTVNGGLLNGALMGPLSAQPLIDVSSGVHILSPRGQHDVALGEGAQFNATAQWIGEYQSNLRVLEGKLGVSISLLADFNSTTSLSAQPTNLTFPVAAGDIWLVEFGGRWSLASGTAGVKLAVSAPTGAVLDGGIWADLGALTTGTSAVIASTALSSAFNTVAATLEPFEGYCRIKMDGTNAGSITLQIAPAAAVVATVKAGAWMRASRVTEV